MMAETIVIKVGGHASDQLPEQFYSQLSKWQTQGKHILIIHGGGPQINEWSNQMGLAVHKQNGIRVTDQQTLALTQAVLLGVVQPAICQQISRHHLSVVGLNTSDNQLLSGEYLDQTQYGRVGKIASVNYLWLNDVLDKEIGVLAPLAQTTDGQLLNVNADTAAAAIAAKMGANKLVLLTDVPGVLNAGKVVPLLDQNAADKLFQQQQIKAGMMPKIKAAFHALHSGVHQVLITNDLSNSGTVLHKSSANSIIG